VLLHIGRLQLFTLACRGSELKYHIDATLKALQAGAMPRRPINGFATTSLSSTIFSGSAAKPRVVGPSMIAAPSRGLYLEL
jgi:hypothetical protein